VRRDAPIDTERALARAVRGLHILGVAFAVMASLLLIPALTAPSPSDYILLAMGTIVLTPGVIAIISGFCLKRRQVWAGKAAMIVVGAAMGVAGTLLLLCLLGLPDTWMVVLICGLSLASLSALYFWLYLGMHALRRHLAPRALGFAPLMAPQGEDATPRSP